LFHRKFSVEHNKSHGLTSSSNAPTFSEALRQGAEVYQKLKSLAKKKYGQSAGNVGDEGGVAPDIQTAEEALDLITEAIEQAGYTGQINIAMDVASSEFYKEDAKKYDLDFKNPDSDPEKWITYEQLADQYKYLAGKYPIVSIEDPFAEDDWEAWSYFYKTSDFQIVGDDLTVTNPVRIKKAIELKSCNALLLKVNQIGTLTESIQAAKDSYAAGWGVMVSHRSGETEDVTIADIVVGIRAGQIKTGAPARSERLAKLNQVCSYIMHFCVQANTFKDPQNRGGARRQGYLCWYSLQKLCQPVNSDVQAVMM